MMNGVKVVVTKENIFFLKLEKLLYNFKLKFNKSICLFFSFLLTRNCVFQSFSTHGSAFKHKLKANITKIITVGNKNKQRITINSANNLICFTHSQIKVGLG